MNTLFLIFLLVFLVIMVNKNRVLMKRMKKVKKYTACTEAVFNRDEHALEVINDFLEREDSLEFQNKAHVVKAYVEDGKGLDACTTFNLFDLKEIILKDGKSFDKNKTNFNSDTFVWLLALLIRAESHQDLECAQMIYDKVDACSEYLSNDLATRMIKATYQIYNEQNVEDNLQQLRDIYLGNYAGLNYDKNVIGIYKYLSLALIRYFNGTVNEDEGKDLVEFSKMKIGHLLLEDLGLYEEYNSLKALDETTENVDEETSTVGNEAEIVEETNDTAETADCQNEDEEN